MTPYYQDKGVTLYQGDALEVLRTLPEHSVDSVVTDPPYGLSFMGRKWDYDVPAVEIWAECLRVIKPGGHLLAFAGTRTQHRMAVRIEDAGFEIRDMIAWVYGSGFPKSLDVSKAIDAHAGADRKVVGVKSEGNGNGRGPGFRHDGDADGLPVTAPTTDAAKQWDGWGTALKPALEPITMARKPLIGTVADNVLTHGTGGINVDACRVEADWANDPSKRGFGHGYNGAGYSIDRNVEFGAEVRTGWEPNKGRWPANLIHDGSDEVVSHFPAHAGAFAPVRGTEPSAASTGNVTGLRERVATHHHGDSGSAARFFYTAKASKEDRDEGLRAMAAASAGEMTGGRAEGSAGLNNPRAGAGRTAGGKNIHPTVKPTSLMQYLCRLVTPPGGVILDTFMGSGSTGKAAILEGFGFVGIDNWDEMMPIAKGRILAARSESVAVRHVDLQGRMSL